MSKATDSLKRFEHCQSQTITQENTHSGARDALQSAQSPKRVGCEDGVVAIFRSPEHSCP
jgi:hypothetical protein